MKAPKYKAVLVRVDPKELTAIKKAAKAERRSMSQFFVLAALEAAKRVAQKEGVAA